MSFEESPAERAIREAMERGAFDNLPGRGKPLPPPDDALTPPELRLAHRILKNANVPPDWVQTRAEVEKSRAAIASLWERIAREDPPRRARANELSTISATKGKGREEHRRAFAEWRAGLRDELERTMRRVNSDILTLNLKAPSGVRPEIPYRVEDELARFDATFPPLPGTVVEHDGRPEHERRDPADVLRGVLAARMARRDRS